MASGSSKQDRSEVRSVARSRYLQIDGTEIHATEWGAPGAPGIVMWHGLARTGRDFE